MIRHALVLIVLATPAAIAQSPGADVMKQRCVSCHDSDIITSQKLTLTGWTRSVDKMVRWGATITAAERDVLQPYLAASFGPKPAASHATSEAGAASYQRSCLTCHDADIIEQQKLSRIGWTRSVEKMMRWGATVGADEKDPLVDYLASRYGPR